MEASLQDLTRGLDRFGALMSFTAFEPTFDPALEVEIELVGETDDDEVVIEYVFDHTPIEDAFADPWFAAHDDTAEVPEDEAPAHPNRGLPAIVGFGLAVALAMFVHALTL